MQTAEQNIISVSELNQKAKRLLQTQLAMVWVRGEISNFSRPASGHWYFTLKDQGAQIRCAMFKGRNRLTRFTPKEGDEVILRGNVSLYEARGDYQLIAEHIEAEGEGRLRQAFELIKKQLASEGLFDVQHKQALPKFPKHVAIISSATGAAVHDMCSVFKRRWPQCQLSIFPCRVQGNEAPSEICHALELANQHANNFENPIEAIIVGRGGGSLEDLQAFNEESVARAIFASELPIVSAVGHEIDFSISDFVADQRAATPTAAAEILAPNYTELSQQFDYFENNLVKLIQNCLQQLNYQLQALKKDITHPREKLNYYRQRFNQINVQLKHAIKLKTNEAQRDLKSLQQRLFYKTPEVDTQREQLSDVYAELQQAIEQFINNKQQALFNSAALLNTVSPLSTLQRGYAIVSDADNNISRDASQFKKGDAVHIKLAKGQIKASVNSVINDPKKKPKAANPDSKT